MTRKLSFLSAAALVAGLSSAVAGTPMAVPAPPVMSEDSGLGVEISLGYDTDYIFRGEELWEDSVWGQVEIGIPLCEAATLTLTPWFLSAVDDDYTETDLNASLDMEFAGLSVSAGYAGYFYPRGGLGGNEGINDEHEAFLSVSKEVGLLEVGALAAYNFDRDGTYLEASLGASIDLTESVALEPSVAVGYSSNYFADDGFTHVLLSLGLPIKLTESATLTPYIAGNIPLDVLNDGQDAKLFGGVALAVSF